jgi:hypothetical protein
VIGASKKKVSVLWEMHDTTLLPLVVEVLVLYYVLIFSGPVLLVALIDSIINFKTDLIGPKSEISKVFSFITCKNYLQNFFC